MPIKIFPPDLQPLTQKITKKPKKTSKNIL